MSVEVFTEARFAGSQPSGDKMSLNRSMMSLSIDLVLKHIKGGPAVLRDLMRKHHQGPPPIATISKWKQRGSISSEWVGAVIWTCAREAIDPLLLLENLE